MDDLAGQCSGLEEAVAHNANSCKITAAFSAP
jgi:hypothetical protein